MKERTSKMTEKTTNKPLKIRTYHSETAVKKGESTEAYKARKLREEAKKLEQERLENIDKMAAKKRGKRNAKTVVIIEMILGIISTICVAYFTLINIQEWAWIRSIYFYISLTISLIILGILNRTLTFIEQKL